jgi:hypothetical protein
MEASSTHCIYVRILVPSSAQQTTSSSQGKEFGEILGTVFPFVLPAGALQIEEQSQIIYTVKYKHTKRHFPSVTFFGSVQQL